MCPVGAAWRGASEPKFKARRCHCVTLGKSLHSLCFLAVGRSTPWPCTLCTGVRTACVLQFPSPFHLEGRDGKDLVWDMTFAFAEASWIGGSVSIYSIIGRDRVYMGAIGDATLEGNAHRKFGSRLMPKEISENYWHLKQKFSLSFQKNNRCLNVSGKGRGKAVGLFFE